ncbi:MAG: trypsin-like serine protease [Clostridiaceae bacterium]|nr:trypsin-like serine protease [Clostridiaceae bacterium]
MFRDNRKRVGFAGMLIISIVTSMAICMLVLFAAPRYISLNDPTADGGARNNAEQIGAKQGRDGIGDELLRIAGQSPSDKPVQIGQNDGDRQGTALSEGPASAAGPGSIPVTQIVAKKATAGVVGITVERAVRENLFDRNRETEVGFGSGVVVSSDGYILTNNHVAGGKSNRIIVSFADGRNVDGVVVWSDPVLDLAAVKVNLNGLTPLPLGDASTLEVGEHAIAIGNPLGLDFQRSVTSGIISALNRTISIETENGTNYMEDLIQTDASINPGNSGGPLLNAKGEVIGINTVKVTSAEGMGFAIPINITKPVVDKLVRTGTFEEPYMGMFAYDGNVIPYIDGEAKLKEGIYVAHVDSRGPAQKAGIREGCIIRQVDGRQIDTMMQLRTYIYSKSPGDPIQINHKMHGSNEWVTTTLVLAKKYKDGLITR